MIKLNRILTLMTVCLALLAGGAIAEKGKASSPETAKTTVTTKQPVAISIQKLPSRAGEQINWQVISNGGTSAVSSGYSLQGTIFQTAVGIGSSADYNAGHGYWIPMFNGKCCIGMTGDINYDKSGPDITDLVFLVTYMFSGGATLPCMEEADINGSGSGPDISDLVYLVTYMFSGGPTPAQCL